MTLDSFFARLWKTSRALTGFGVAMIVFTAIMGGLALIDPTLIDGHVRWIKPAKFGVSFVVYSFSVAFVLSFIPRSKLSVFAARTLAATGVLEIGIITLQAFRGRVSHFNTETLLDGILFNLMGAGIAMFFAANIVAVLLAIRARIGDRVLAIGLKLGLAVASIGMAEALLMLTPTGEQMAVLAKDQQPPRLGSRTVGEVDRGLPILGWNTAGGDLRPAHFFGMHALQLIPFFALAIRRRRRWSEEQKVKLVWTASSAHLALTVLLTVQALRGQSVIAPDAITIAAFASILFATCLASFLIVQPASSPVAEVMR